MTYVKIGNSTYEANIDGRLVDSNWNNRASKAITIEMTFAKAIDLFVDDVNWSIIYETETGSQEYDNSDYCVAGSITDNRNGTITVKMGKITAEEALAELMEVMA